MPFPAVLRASWPQPRPNWPGCRSVAGIFPPTSVAASFSPHLWNQRNQSIKHVVWRKAHGVSLVPSASTPLAHAEPSPRRPALPHPAATYRPPVISRFIAPPASAAVHFSRHQSPYLSAHPQRLEAEELGLDRDPRGWETHMGSGKGTETCVPPRCLFRIPAAPSAFCTAPPHSIVCVGIDGGIADRCVILGWRSFTPSVPDTDGGCGIVGPCRPWANETLTVLDGSGQMWTEAMVDKLEREVMALRREVDDPTAIPCSSSPPPRHPSGRFLLTLPPATAHAMSPAAPPSLLLTSASAPGQVLGSVEPFHAVSDAMAAAQSIGVGWSSTGQFEQYYSTN